MATLYTHKDKNIRKTWILVFLFLIFVIAVGYVFSYVLDEPAILVLAVLFSILMSFVSYWWSDKIVLFISKAHLLDPEKNKELYRLVENLCITAGLPLPRIYIIDDPAMNAFATGRNPKHAVIALTSGLIQRLERVELEGVIAHELSHIGNRDMLLSTMIVILVGFVTLLADWFRRATFYGFSGRRRRDSQDAGGAIMLIIALVLAIVAPLAATIIQLAISRKREFLADASGALLTRYPEGLASALKKISKDSFTLKSANKATAHLYISNPFRGKRLFEKLFSTHPPIEERVAALLGMKL